MPHHPIIHAVKLPLLLLVLITSCHSCPKAKEAASQKVLDYQELFRLDQHKLFAKTDQFLLTSDLFITIGQGDLSETTREIIEVSGQKPHLLFKKRTSDSKEIQIFLHDESVMIKDHNGPFHEALDNKDQINELIHDGLNATAWLINQFGIEDYIKNQPKNNNKITINFTPDIHNSSFIKTLTQSYAPFSSLKKSIIRGTMHVDENSGLLKEAQFEIDIMGLQKSYAKLGLRMKIADLKNELIIPKAAPYPSLVTPVNIKPRFSELLQKKASNL